MKVRARKTWPDAPQDQYVAEPGNDTVLHPCDVLETLEISSYVDDDIGAARGLVNAGIIGAVVWALIIVTYLLLI